MESSDLNQKLQRHLAWRRGESDGERADLRGADLRGADLTDAVLRGADLRGAVLTGAVLTGAVLRGADLRGAVLTGADLRGADLRGADLTDAVLTGADLRGADLRDADLRDAVLTDAVGASWLREAREDIWRVLSWAPAEAPAVLKALEEGRVDGSCYSGECACLVGTIANARGVDVDEIPFRLDDADELAKDADSPAERFFARIRPGHTPDISMDAALAACWVREFIRTHGPQQHGGGGVLRSELSAAERAAVDDDDAQQGGADV